MASQSPDVESMAGALDDASSYLQGWAALARLIDTGHSWSGHERHCAFLNRGDGGFVDVSAISGLDFDDDGRACVATDFDGDGDLDLVFKNRSGPQLRFARNDFGSGRSIRLRLCDEGANRDAIGALVELRAGDRRLVRHVSAGDGYLGQASRWLHFGLEGLPAVEVVAVRWPDGVVEEFAAPEGPGRFFANRGEGVLEAVAVALRRPPQDELSLPELPMAAAVVLREPLPLPPTLVSVGFRGKPRRPLLLAAWLPSCESCVREIRGLTTGRGEVAAADVDVLFLGLGAPPEQAEAALRFAELAAAAPELRMRQRPASAAVQQALAAVAGVVLGVEELPRPFALLIDRDLEVQVVYAGGLDVATLRNDARRFAHGEVAGPQRSRRAGRWAFAVQRSLAPFVRDLQRRGLSHDADFFLRLAKGRSSSREDK